jgi:hypothetical protein
MLAALSAVAAFAVISAACSLLGPKPAGAQAHNVPRFLFGPMFVPTGGGVELDFFNTAGAGRATPPYTVDFVASDGTVAASIPQQGVPADRMGGAHFGQDAIGRDIYLVRLVFAAPVKGQAIPSPFAATVTDFDSQGNVLSVLGPAH